VSASRTAAGILFHTTGPATEKAVSPNFVNKQIFESKNIFKYSVIHTVMGLVVVKSGSSINVAVLARDCTLRTTQPSIPPK